MMAATMDIRILDMDEAKALADRLRRMTRYAAALEAELQSEQNFADHALDAVEVSEIRAENGITDVDMELPA